MGIGTTDPELINEVELVEPIVDICCGKNHIYARSKNLNLYFWGKNDNKKFLMENDDPFISFPTQIPAFEKKRIYFLHSNPSFTVALMKKHIVIWGKIFKKNQEKEDFIFTSPKKIPFSEEFSFDKIAFLTSINLAIIILTKEGKIFYLSDFDSFKWMSLDYQFRSIFTVDDNIHCISENYYQVFSIQQNILKEIESDNDPINSRTFFPISGERMKKKKLTLDYQIKNFLVDENKFDALGRNITHYGKK